MKPLKDLKKELKNLVPSGVDLVLKTLKQYLPESSVKFNSLIELDARYRENHRKIQMGTIGNEQSNIETNKIREAILELIDALKEEDFEARAPALNKSGRRKGKILYRIPDTMQLEVATTCLVRIAFDEETLTYDISIQTGDEIKELRRVSDVMSVVLLDPSDNQFFKISTFSETVQFVDEDDYTEWSFFVTPLAEGEFPLILKVSVIELKLGKERKRDIVLEEQVKIITTTAVEDNNTMAFKEAGESLQTGQAISLTATPDVSSASAETKKDQDGEAEAGEEGDVILVTPPPVLSAGGSKVLTGGDFEEIDLPPNPSPSTAVGTDKKKNPTIPRSSAYEPRPQSPPRKRSGPKTGIISLLGLLVIAGFAWAMPGVREEVRWVNTAYIQNDKEAFASYQKKYPDSPRKQVVGKRIENFEWQEVILATTATKEKELIDYRQKYPELKGRYFKEATIQLADIEYERLPETAAAEEIVKIINKYPDTPAAEKATERLAKREYRVPVKELDNMKIEELTKKYPTLKKNKVLKKQMELIRRNNEN